MVKLERSSDGKLHFLANIITLRPSKQYMLFYVLIARNSNQWSWHKRPQQAMDGFWGFGFRVWDLGFGG